MIFLYITKTRDKGVFILTVEQLIEPRDGDKIAIIKTNFGVIRIRLFPEIAPKAVENFIGHAKAGYYDELTFHRVMNDFMIQGGDPNGTGMGGKSIWGRPFEDEFNHDYHNYRGALSMANSGPNTNGSQFFIVQKPDIEASYIEKMRQAGEENGYSEEVIKTYADLGGTPWLDYRHTVFGQVFEGMDVVDRIARIEVDTANMPIEPVRIETIEIIEHK